MKTRPVEQGKINEPMPKVQHCTSTRFSLFRLLLSNPIVTLIRKSTKLWKYVLVIYK